MTPFEKVQRLRAEAYKQGMMPTELYANRDFLFQLDEAMKPLRCYVIDLTQQTSLSMFLGLKLFETNTEEPYLK